jgi:argininosuccinate lyase
VQLSRGKAEATLVFEIALLMKDLGRLAADLCLFATTEFGFVKLPDSMTTGSSIMPQKRNPDVFELIRARAARAPSRVQEIMALTAGLTSGYHRDLQLIKEPLFASIDDALATLTMMTHAVRDLQFVAERTESAMDSSLDAAERANRLVQDEGITFREAYRRIAKDL